MLLLSLLLNLTLESVNRYGDNRSFRDEYPVYFHIAVRHPLNPISDRVQPPRLHDHRVQVLRLPQLLVSRPTLKGGGGEFERFSLGQELISAENKSLRNLPGNSSVDLCLQFLLDLRVEGQVVGCKGHSTCHVIITNNGKYQGLHSNLLISHPCSSNTSE